MSQDYPISDENEEEESGQVPFNLPNFMKAFLLGPDGNPTPISMNDLLSRTVEKNTVKPLTSFLHNEYELVFIDKIKTSDNSTRLLLECIENRNCSFSKKYTIMDAYEYLSNSHLINFAVSWFLGIPVWSHEAIDLQLQVNAMDKNSYSKIVILVDSCNVSNLNNMLETSAVDAVITRFTDMLTDIPATPIISQCIRAVSYYNPLIIYDITMAFNDSSKLKFENINIGMLYSVILSRYISDAADIFYPMTPLDIDSIGEKIMRIQFDIEWTGRLCNIKMLCMPSVCYFRSTDQYYRYCYENINLHSVSTKCLTEGSTNVGVNKNIIELVEFINSINSSDLTQVLITDIEPRGIVTNYCEDYKLINTANILFTVNRHITNINYNGRIVICDALSSTCDCAKDYWVASKPVEFLGKQLLGFINLDVEKVCNMKFIDVFKKLNDDTKRYFGISATDIDNNRVTFSICYSTSKTCRLMIAKNSSKGNSKQSKKRIFGGIK